MQAKLKVTLGGVSVFLLLVLVLVFPSSNDGSSSTGVSPVVLKNPKDDPRKKFLDEKIKEAKKTSGVLHKTAEKEVHVIQKGEEVEGADVVAQKKETPPTATTRQEKQEEQKQNQEQPEDCESRTDEVICQGDERWSVQSQRSGTGEGSEEEPFKSWNIDYHRKRAAHRLRYEKEDAEIKEKGLKHRPTRIHTFYTIDCTYHSLWQVLTLEMSWEEVNQGGVISRVSSGCNSAPKDKQQALGKYILSEENLDKIGTFYAPTFSRLPNGEKYAPFNRPNGIWYWLNHTDLTEDVYICLDPDMLYLNRLVVSNIKPGHFASQYYGYMTGSRYDKYKCPECPDPAYYQGKDTQSAHRRVEKYHPKRPPHKKLNFDVGPPWIFTLEDLRTIMPSWVKIVVHIKKMDPGNWIAEMVAYSVACAFHDIPHDVIYHGMVDNVGQDRVWQGPHLSSAQLPHPIALLHYCFTWEVGENPPKDQAGADVQVRRMEAREKTNHKPVIDYYHFSKYRVPTDWPGGAARFTQNILDCKAPLMQEFHTERALPDIDKRNEWKRTTQFIELFIPQLNKALTKWKMHVKQCPPDQMNLEKRLRTAHPRFWISDYVINNTMENKEIEWFKSTEFKEKFTP